MRLRPTHAMILGLLASLAGCAGLPSRPPLGDPDNCRAQFQRYDQAVRLFGSAGGSLAPEGHTTQPSAVSRAANAIMTGGCLTSGNDLRGIEALQAELGLRTPVNSGVAITPTAVHVGVLTGGFVDAGRAVAFFQSQGYQTRTIGAERLGRRLYIGPVTSQGALDQAIALAARAGFPSAYPSDLFQFWKF